MHGEIVQFWAENETNVILSHSSTFSTLAELLAGIERTFGDPDQERTRHTVCVVTPVAGRLLKLANLYRAFTSE